MLKKQFYVLTHLFIIFIVIIYNYFFKINWCFVSNNDI